MIAMMRWWLLAALLLSGRMAGQEMDPAALLGLSLEGAARSYLVDPQELLPEDVRTEREEFLAYHAAESSIDVRVMLLDAGQSLPGGVDAEFLVDRFFRQDGAVCLAVYFMGEPQRAQLALSEELRERAGEGTGLRMLQSATMAAQEWSDPVDQFTEFCKQLTIRVFWIEEEVGMAAEVVPRPRVVVPDAMEEKERPAPAIGKPLARWGAKALMVVLALGLLGFGWWLRRRGARFRFPDTPVAPRLGGEHGAGIGAVVHFGSTTDSPTTQRDKVPDLLGGL